MPQHFVCGYLIRKDGIWPDPAKVTSLTKMPASKDVHDVRRFLGLANQLGRFSPNLASLSQPLRDLLVKRNSWCWTESHQTAFDRIKAELSSQPVLALVLSLVLSKLRDCCFCSCLRFDSDLQGLRINELQLELAERLLDRRRKKSEFVERLESDLKGTRRTLTLLYRCVAKYGLIQIHTSKTTR